MKLLTHVITSLSATLAVLYMSSLFNDVYVVNAVFITSLTTNYLIDMLGHRNKSRTALTHEVFNNVLISLITSLAIWVVLFSKYHLIIAVITSLAISSTHLLMDLLTGYIYIRGLNNNVRKIRLSLRRYDDFLLNTIAIGISELIIFLTMLTTFIR